MSIKQGDMITSQYFTKFTSLCDEIQQVDVESAINEVRMWWIIMRALEPNYSGHVTAGGWETLPFLVELESIMANKKI